MTNLEKLIQEFCPNGVEFKELKQILTIKNGRDYKQLGSGSFPVYGSGGVMAYVDCYAYNKPSVLIPRKGSVDKLYYVTEPFWNVDTIFYTEINEDKVIPQYVYYCLQKEHLEKYNTAGGVPSLTQTVLNKVKIPVPPLPVQREIVRILDSFTELTAALTAALTAELTARRKQYEYYRDELLAPISNIQYTVYTLGDIATVTKLAGFEFTNYVTYSNDGEVIALRGLNVKNGKLDLSDVKYIDNSDLTKLTRSKLHTGDMLFTYVGTIGQVAVIDEDNKYYLAPNVALIRCDKNIILPEYMRYYFQSSEFWNTQINKLLQSSSMKNIPMEKIRKFKLCIPPVETQCRIVNILDRFDALCNDLTSGLPAEIEARRKQYEYYRDKLLTFEEKTS